MFVAAKVAKKFLMHEPFFVDGFEYQFISVEPAKEVNNPIPIAVPT